MNTDPARKSTKPTQVADNREETSLESSADRGRWQISGNPTQASLEALIAKSGNRLICGRCGEMGKLTRVEYAHFTVICHREGKFCCRPIPENTPELALTAWERFHDDY